MGLADRDYMKERARERVAQTSPSYSRSRPVEFSKPSRSWGLLIALSMGVSLYGVSRDMLRSGWLPDFAVERPFPHSGDVVVNRNVDPLSATSRLSIVTSQSNAVVQLFRMNGEHVLSVFARGDDRITVPVPPGRFRMKLAEGRKWYGRERFFGRSMTYENVAKEMVFETNSEQRIDLNRTVAGNLQTGPTFARPGFGD